MGDSGWVAETYGAYGARWCSLVGKVKAGDSDVAVTRPRTGPGGAPWRRRLARLRAACLSRAYVHSVILGNDVSAGIAPGRKHPARASIDLTSTTSHPASRCCPACPLLPLARRGGAHAAGRARPDGADPQLLHSPGSVRHGAAVRGAAVHLHGWVQAVAALGSGTGWYVCTACLQMFMLRRVAGCS